MRRTISLVIALIAGLCVAAAPSAVAGGPTSVLIVNQVDGRGAGVVIGSDRYDTLLSSLGGEGRPTASPEPPAVPEGASSIKLVWLIHDVEPWRIDQVHVVGDAVWVQTFFSDGGNPYESAPVWHRPARGEELVAGLTALGVHGDRPVTGASSTPVIAADPAMTTPAIVPAASEGASWWLVTVLVLGGLALGAIGGRQVPARLLARPPLPAR